jgi:hypothetical protein
MNHFAILFLVIFPVAILIPCEPFKSVPILPKDESSKDASFTKFKTQLLKAVKSKDVNFLLDAIDPQIHFSFGGDAGKKSFIKSFELDKTPNRSEVWTILDNTLKLGYFLNGEGHFVSPYLFENFPDSLDPTMYSVIAGTNVNVRAEPNIKSKVIDKLSYQIVGLDYATENVKTDECNWQKVCLADTSTGYVCEKYLRSPLEYRIFFEKKKQKWMITVFIAGD